MALFVPSQMQKALARRLFEWHVDFFDGRRIEGWIGCRKARRTASLVTFHSHAGSLGTTFTTIARTDVAALGYIPAGFRFVFDEEVEGPIDILATNPAATTTWTTLERNFGPMGCGVVESMSATRIRGWAALPRRRTKENVKVALWRGSVEVARTDLSIVRNDIATAFDLTDPMLGFDLGLPLEATLFSRDLFVLKVHYGDETFVIKERLSFVESEATFQRTLAFDLSTQRWT